MARADYSVSQLVDMIKDGTLRLPEMQRKYVWTSTRVRDLLDSLYRGYPSGVILAWQSDSPVDTAAFAVDVEDKVGVQQLLLLDGQQRLTSLSAILRGVPVDVRNRKKPIDILFNLEHPAELVFSREIEENADEDYGSDFDAGESDIQKRFAQMAFIVASNQLKASAHWVSVTEIFKSTETEILKRVGISSFDDPRFEKYSARIAAVKAIAQYQYRMDTLERTKSYEEVTEIFVRVNSLGAKLRSSDLAMAQITAKWPGSLRIFQSYEKELRDMGFDVELGTLLKTLVALITHQSRFLTVHALSVSQLQEGWERTKRAITHAINFMHANIGVDSTALLSSPFLITTTAYWADKNDYVKDAESARSFRQWFLIANAKGRYSRGSSESYLDQDLAVMRDGGSTEGLTQRLIQQVGRLDFTADDLIGRTSTSGAFKTMFLAFRQSGVQDWTTHLDISPKHIGKADSIEYHHIFPKAYLKKERPGLDRTVVNEVANLAFIGGSTNRKISAKAPSLYKHDFSEADLLSQLIDFSDGLDSATNFENFLLRRRTLIADALNEFLEI